MVRLPPLAALAFGAVLCFLAVFLSFAHTSTFDVLTHVWGFAAGARLVHGGLTRLRA